MNFFPWRRPAGAAPPAAAPAPAGASVTPLDILSALAQGVVAVGADRRVILCNDAVAPLLNRPAREAVGRPIWEILRHREVLDVLDRLWAGGPEETRDITFPLPAETVWRLRARPLAAGALLTFMDMTNVRRLETVRRDFVANVSHELKTPLTSLRAALETLLDGALEDPAHGRDFLATALEQVERLQRLIEDLLTLSRLEKEAAPSPGKSSVRTVVQKTLAALQPLADRAGVSLKAGLPEASLAAALPEDELTQVLMNLLDNAVKFNRKGGSAALAAEAAGGSLRLAVSDTGAGIPPEDQPRVFERFYRVDKSRGREVGGTGLGLAIVKHIVENRGGSIRLESVPGQGSTFTVTLPLA